MRSRRLARYLFAFATVAVALALRLALAPLTGPGAPFVLFFGATLLTSLVAGAGPGLCTLLTSLPIAAYLFVVRAGWPVAQAAVQALLYGVDGVVIIYLTSLTTRARRALEAANGQLRTAHQAAQRSEARARDLIDLAPDPFFLADLDGRFTEVNQAACHMLGCEHRELVGKTIADIIPPEDVPRLAAVKAELLLPGGVHKSEWRLKRKDGTFVSVEISANILSDGRWQAFGRDVSERRRVEDERQVFISLLDNSSDFIGIADPTGRPIYLNRGGRRMVGLPPDFPVEQIRIEECYPRDLRSFAADVIVKTMVEQGRWSGETFLRHWKTEAAIPVSDEHFLIRDARGERILGMGTIIRDISEAQRVSLEREELLSRERRALSEAESANQRLRDSEERFRLTIDEAPIGMALVSLEGRFLRVNRALCEIVGYEAAELTGLTFPEITHPDDVDKDLTLAGQLGRGEIPRYQLEKRYVRKNGTFVDVLLSGSVLRGPDGAPIHYIAQVEDITERKRAEEALRRSEAKHFGIVSIAADAIISVDEEQRITLFNQGAERIFGYSAGEVLGQPLHLLIPERFREVHPQHFAAFASGRETSRRMGDRTDIFGVRKNGEEFPAEASISKVSVGGATFFSVVLRDITARKQIEEDLQRAVTAREQVLSIVAHDLRNPLASIMVQASLLKRRGPEPDRRTQKPRETIARTAERMNRLIQDLLDATLVEAGQLKIDRAPLSAEDLVLEAVDAQSALAAASGVELRLELEPDLPQVWGSHDRLLQVFENLIGNALKFTEAGGRITVGAVSRQEDVMFSVADTGCGIAPESLPHVFDRFWQATTRAGRLGAGLGLPITKGIIEAHGGSICAESTPGSGSVFYFTIPRAMSPDARPSDVVH